MTAQADVADLFVIGGGINGCGIARDAAGRGLSVVLAEKGDLAQATSSASTKLFHGGLRYLEYFEFRLVREALAERETLLAAMPHISWPMRFVLPYSPDMRFEGDTPTARLLGTVMPWMRGRRPAWLIRLGLFLYDTLGGRKILPRDPHPRPRQRSRGPGAEADVPAGLRVFGLLGRGFAARRAQRPGCGGARRADHGRHAGRRGAARGRALAGHDRRRRTAGPSIGRGRWSTPGGRGSAPCSTTSSMPTTTRGVRLVRGSHIVTRRLYDHDRCYFFQGTDGRIIFAIPYEQDFTLIGTTDIDHEGPPEAAACSEAERDYLLAFASRYFAKPVTAADVVWTYSGVRPLYDDGASSATAATRDYVLALDDGGGGDARRRRRSSASSAARSPPTAGWRKGRSRSSRRSSRRRRARGRRGCRCRAATSRSTGWRR